MDEEQYSTLMEAVTAVPDPRKARGKRFAWSLLLALICSALARGQHDAHAIGDWVHNHARELRRRLHPTHGRLPSESTLRRTIRAIDLPALEQQLARVIHPQDTPALPAPVVLMVQQEPLVAQAIDGKTVRGATRRWDVIVIRPATVLSLIHAPAMRYWLPEELLLGKPHKHAMEIVPSLVQGKRENSMVHISLRLLALA